MKINNETSFSVHAIGEHETRGLGKAEIIPTKQSKEIIGPFLGVMGGGRCDLIIPGEITCQEKPDDSHGFQVLEGQPLIIRGGEFTITVSHINDMIKEENE